MPVDLQFSQAEFVAVLPATVMFATGLILLFTDLYLPRSQEERERRSSKSHLVFIGCAGSVLALLAVVMGDRLLDGNDETLFSGALSGDGFGAFAAGLVVVAALLSTLASGGYLGAHGENRGEYYGLLYLGAGSMILLAQATNLISIFVAIETLSLSVYVLAGFFRGWRAGSEGALKYFVMGAFSSGFLLLGLAFLFGATGSIELSALGRAGADPSLLNMGLILALVGFAFKVGAVPFHSWVPDAYQGAPATAAGWMAVAVKACSFAALLRLVIATAGGPGHEALGKMLAALAVITMILGNYAALNQTNIKRLLAYSGIAHTGYLLIPVVLAYQQDLSATAGAGVLFYLVAYLLMTLGAFTVVALVSNGDTDREELEAFRGLANRYPLVALAMTISLVSLAGIPLTAGFMGKLYIFKDAVDGGYLYLALIGVLASLVSVYYYLRPVIAMYFHEEETPVGRVESTWGLHLTLFLTSVLTLWVGIFPERLIALSEQSIRQITG